MACNCQFYQHLDVWRNIPISFARSDPFQIGACSGRKTQPKKQCLEAFPARIFQIMSLHSPPSPFKDDTLLVIEGDEPLALFAMRHFGTRASASLPLSQPELVTHSSC
jgi:hypothetical protein